MRVGKVTPVAGVYTLNCVYVYTCSYSRTSLYLSKYEVYLWFSFWYIDFTTIVMLNCFFFQIFFDDDSWRTVGGIAHSSWNFIHLTSLLGVIKAAVMGHGP